MSRSQVRQVEFDQAALREARAKAGLTQEQLAHAANMTLRTVTRWELGFAEPKGSSLLALCSILKVAPDDLFREKEQDAA